MTQTLTIDTGEINEEAGTAIFWSALVSNGGDSSQSFFYSEELALGKKGREKASGNTIEPFVTKFEVKMTLAGNPVIVSEEDVTIFHNHNEEGRIPCPTFNNNQPVEAMADGEQESWIVKDHNEGRDVLISLFQRYS